MSDDQKITVSRVIDAPAKDIFRVLSDPQNHALIDGTGMIVSDEKTDRITANGQVFRMNMHNERFNDYQMDNRVTGYAENKLLAWMPGMVGYNDGAPGGWEFVYELAAQGADATEVTLTYDWSKVTDKGILKTLSFPVLSAEQLESSLARLAEAVAS
ncbi:MAG: polyketide cyclase [Austwickia sp.]|jgi:uncharacterized protein YndB with AHSA1/START domain|nr:MAG: polyketide cyclase [Austwickia sp.]